MNQQLTSNEFFKFVDEFKKERESDTANQRATLRIIEKLADKITKTNERIISKTESKNQPTIKEELQAGVAGVKKLGSRIASGFSSVGSGIKSLVKNPIEAIKAGGTAIGTKIADTEIAVENYLSDIFAAPKEMPSAKKDKTASIDKKPTESKLVDSAPIERALSAKEKFVQTNVTEEAKNKFGVYAATRQAEKQYDQNVRSMGEFAASRNAEKMYQEKFPALLNPKQSEDKNNKIQDFLTSQNPQKIISNNPESDNIETPEEILADTSKDNLDISKQLLETTKDSLTQLRAIREVLSVPSAEVLPSKPVEQSSAVQQDQGGGLLDQFGNLIRGGSTPSPSTSPNKPVPQKQTMGSKILGGAKSVGSKVLSAARFAGPVAAAAGAVVGGVSGYNRAEEVFGVQQGEATIGQKLSSAVGGIADPFGLGYGDTLAKGIGSFFGVGKKDESVKSTNFDESVFAKNDPTSYKEYKIFISKEIEKGADSSTVKQTAFEKFKEKIIASGATKNQSITNKSSETNIKPTYNEFDMSSEVAPATTTPNVSATTSSVASVTATNNIQPTTPKIAATAQVANTTLENAAMRDEMSTSSTTTPIISNNVSSTSTNNFMPMKADPRPTHRGSALDKYIERVAAY